MDMAHQIGPCHRSGQARPVKNRHETAIAGYHVGLNIRQRGIRGCREVFGMHEVGHRRFIQPVMQRLLDGLARDDADHRFSGHNRHGVAIVARQQLAGSGNADRIGHGLDRSRHDAPGCHLCLDRELQQPVKPLKHLFQRLVMHDRRSGSGMAAPLERLHDLTGIYFRDMAAGHQIDMILHGYR